MGMLKRKLLTVIFGYSPVKFFRIHITSNIDFVRGEEILALNEHGILCFVYFSTNELLLFWLQTEFLRGFG